MGEKYKLATPPSINPIIEPFIDKFDGCKAYVEELVCVQSYG